MQKDRAPHRSRQLWLPALLGLATVLLALGHLLEPGVLPIARDLPFFHLPLRMAFAAEVGELFPSWNPAIHGGQPILSNPNYAAFYPPTWIGRWLAPSWTLGWLLVLHGLLAYAGAWRLMKRLQAHPWSCALGASAFFASGAFLTLTNTLNLFSAMALFPWIVSAGIGIIDNRLSWHREAAWAGWLLGLQLLAGAPEAVVISAIVLVLLALEAPRERWPRLIVVAAIASLIAAVQILPTLDRVSGSSRAGGLGAKEALSWSFPPERVAELAYPRFYGDPARDKEGLFFGWRIHDQNYPYIVSIYPGLLILSLGLVSLLALPVPYRRAWTLAGGLGMLLALGRHNPLYRHSLELLPAIGTIRFPEKFVLLSTSCLAIAGALGWDYLWRQRYSPEGPSARSRLPLVVALGILSGGALLGALLYLSPQLGADFIAAHRFSSATVPVQGQGLAYLRSQIWISMLVAAATATVLATLRHARISPRSAALLATLLLTGDLLYFARGTTPVVDSQVILQPPGQWAERQEAGRRTFAPSFLQGAGVLDLRREEAGTVVLRSRLERFDPYVANLWGYQYVVHADFDRMATTWALHTQSSYLQVAHDEELSRKFLGAWDVAWFVDARSLTDLLRDRLDGRPPRAAEARANPDRKSPFRLPERALFHGDAREAFAAASRDHFDVENSEHLIGGRQPLSWSLPPGEILGTESRGGRIDVRYRSAGESLIVMAVTYDKGWQGEVQGLDVQLYPTALGQMAAVIPAGERTLELRYHQPRLAIGAALTLLGLLLAGWLARRTSPMPPDLDTIGP